MLKDAVVEVGTAELSDEELSEAMEFEAESGIKEVAPEVRRDARAAAAGERSPDTERSEITAVRENPELENFLTGASLTDVLERVRDLLKGKRAQDALDVAEGFRKSGPLTDIASPKLEAHVLWAKTMVPRADVKAILVEIDDLVRAEERDCDIRTIRGIVRKRVGDSDGANADFRHVLGDDPKHGWAKGELGPVAEAEAPRKSGGFLKRLFGK
jgi:hypothetical protein